MPFYKSFNFFKFLQFEFSIYQASRLKFPFIYAQ